MPEWEPTSGGSLDQPRDHRGLWAPATEALGLSQEEVPVDYLLTLTAVIARGVERPMAPVSAFLVGLAVGRGADPQEAMKKLTGLAQDFA